MAYVVQRNLKSYLTPQSSSTNGIPHARRLHDAVVTRSGHEGKGAGSVREWRWFCFPRLPDWRSLLTS